MDDSKIYIKYSSLAAMDLKDGDQVKCVSTTVHGREGKVYTLVKVGRSNNLRHLAQLKFYESYGDRFEKI